MPHCRTVEKAIEMQQIAWIAISLSAGIKDAVAMARQDEHPSCCRGQPQAPYAEDSLKQSLFRHQVFEAKRNRSFGGISLAQPLRLWMLTGGAAIVALMVALFLIFGTYTRRSHVVGQLVPTRGIATVLAPATGVISSMKTAEGSSVSSGQTVAVVTVPRATVGGGDTRQALQRQLSLKRQGLQSTQQAQTLQMDAQRAGLSSQLSAARGELAEIKAEIATREQQVRIADETLARLNELTDENLRQQTTSQTAGIRCAGATWRGSGPAAAIDQYPQVDRPD